SIRPTIQARSSTNPTLRFKTAEICVSVRSQPLEEATVLTSNGRAEARFFYVDVIWGTSYANLFTNVSLASRLSLRNLPAMPNNRESKTILVTTDEDHAHIMRSSLFQQLEKLMEVVFLPLQITTQGKYDLMSTGHRQAIEHVAGQGYCVFFSPDTIV